MSKNEPSWIRRFTTIVGNEFICEVDREFIQDKFNLTNLDEMVPNFREAMRIILDIHEDPGIAAASKAGDKGSKKLNQDKNSLTSAELLYCLIHARFILTDPGLHQMKEKYTKQIFGRCTRYYCEKAAMLPIGLTEEPNQHAVRLFCPRCSDIYLTHLSNSSKYNQTDGAFFGTNFPQMFFMVYPDLRPPKPVASYIPRLYGFQIHPSAYENQLKLSTAARLAKSCIRSCNKRTTTSTNSAAASAANIDTNCSHLARNGKTTSNAISSVNKNK